MFLGLCTLNSLLFASMYAGGGCVKAAEKGAVFGGVLQGRNEQISLPCNARR